MARKVLVEMDMSELNRFNLFERLVKRLMLSTKASEQTVLDVLEKSAETALSPKK